MTLKILVVTLLVLVFYNLSTGLVYLLKDKGKTNRVAKALTWRIGLSFALFIIIMIGAALGWLHPNVIQ